MSVLYIALGGAIGAAARYLAGLWIAAYLGAGFPWGTFFVNVTGSFLIGIVLVLDRKSTRLNSSHANISYAVFCLKKKYQTRTRLNSSHANISYRVFCL